MTTSRKRTIEDAGERARRRRVYIASGFGFGLLFGGIMTLGLFARGGLIPALIIFLVIAPLSGAGFYRSFSRQFEPLVDSLKRQRPELRQRPSRRIATAVAVMALMVWAVSMLVVVSLWVSGRRLGLDIPSAVRAGSWLLFAALMVGATAVRRWAL